MISDIVTISSTTILLGNPLLTLQTGQVQLQHMLQFWIWIELVECVHASAASVL